MTGKIFVNYRRKLEGGWEAEAIATRLAMEFGAEQIFLDVKGIPPGADFAKKLLFEIGQAVALVVVLGKDWHMTQDEETGDKRIGQEDDWVRREIRTAIQRAIPIFPLLIDDAKPPPAKALPDDIKPLLQVQHRPVRQTHVDEDLRSVIDALAEQTGVPCTGAGRPLSSRLALANYRQSLLHELSERQVDPVRPPAAAGHGAQRARLAVPRAAEGLHRPARRPGRDSPTRDGAPGRPGLRQVHATAALAA
jgi:hypothetical protein